MSWNLGILINRLTQDIDNLPTNLTGLNQLTVQNNSTFLSNLNVLGTMTASTSVAVISIITNVSQLNVSGITVLNGATTIKSSLNVSGDTILNDLYLPKISGGSSLNLALSTDNSGKLVTITAGGSTLLSALYVSGNSTLQSNFQVSGNSLMIGASTFNSTLNVSGASVFESSLLIKNNISANSNLNVSGNAILESGLLVKQNQTNLSSLNVSGQTNLSAPLNFINGINILNNGTPAIYPNSNDIYFENSGNGSLVALHQSNDGPTKPVFKTYTNINGPDGTYSQVVKNSASPANNDDLGGWSYIGKNSNNQEKEYARINVNSDSVSNNAEVGSIHFLNMNNGNLIENMNIKNNDVNINNNLNISGSSVFESNNLLKGATTIGSTLNISGASVFESNLLVKQAQTNLSTLNISGASVFESNLLVKQVQTNLSTLNISGGLISRGVSDSIQFGDSFGRGILDAGASAIALKNTGGSVLTWWNQTGNIGIGTTNPSALLHVSGTTIIGNSNVGTGQLRVLDSALGSISDFRGTSNETFIAIGNNNTLSSAIYLGYESSTSQLVIGQRGTKRYMMMNTSGNSNIGVHTQDPKATLHVSGSSIINGTLSLPSISGSSILSTDSNGQIISGSLPGSSTLLSVLEVSGTTLLRGNTTILSPLYVSGNSIISQRLAVNSTGISLLDEGNPNGCKLKIVGSNAYISPNQITILENNAETLTNLRIGVYDNKYSSLQCVAGNYNTTGTFTKPLFLNPEGALESQITAVNQDDTTQITGIFNSAPFQVKSSKATNDFIGSYRGISGTKILEIGNSFVNQADAIYIGIEAGEKTIGWRATCSNITLNNDGSIDVDGVLVPSDQRIKKNIIDIDDKEGLELIRKVEPKKYNYIDEKIDDGLVFGFISNQIKDVIPHATKINKKIIPNIYRTCQLINGNLVYLSNHMLNNENIIRWSINNENYNSNIFVIDNDYFKILGDDIKRFNTDEIFIFGYQIHDFVMLDKNYIYTLNVCATQELDREIQTIKKENEENKNIINDLLNRIKLLENK